MTTPWVPQETPFQSLDRASVESVEERNRTLLLRKLLSLFLSVTLGVAAIGFGTAVVYRGVIASFGALGFGLLLALLPRLGSRRAGVLCTVWYFVLTLGAIVLGEGIRAVGMVLLPSGILIAALMLPKRVVAPWVAASVAAVTAIGVAKWSHLLASVGEPASLEEVAVAALLLLATGVLIRIVVGNLESMIAKRQRAERALLTSRDELAARHMALQQVNELASRLHRSLDVDEIARQAVEVLVRYSAPSQVGFYLLEEPGDRLLMTAHHGFAEEIRALGEQLPVAGSLSGVAVRERRLVWSEDLARDARVEPSVGAALVASGITAALVIPLAFGNRVLGTVNLLFRDPPTWTDVEMDTFRGIGQAVSLALTNARHVAGLEHQAFHDPLTGLLNRAGFHRELAALVGAAGSPSSEMEATAKPGVVLIDLRRFREINDALGHHVGDRLLVALAGRLGRRVGNDGARLFRLGGDEFLLMVPAVADGVAGLERARELLSALSLPYEIDGMSIEVEAAAGVAIFPEHGRDSHELLRCADVAVYRAKRAGSTVELYSPSFDEHTAERLALAGELGKAVREGGLELHYQPKVALADGRVVGFEALVRWRHPRLGLLLPASFLPIAEASDLIHPLTYWVVEKALEQLLRWQREHEELAGARMAVNLSVRNLLDGSCAVRIEEILRRVGVAPASLELELTETAVMSDPEAAVVMLGRITATGARLAIDDFGTGYSSLAYLRRFPVQALKIDRSFVAELAGAESQRSQAIVRSTLYLARSLELTTIAEGVETPDAALRLRDLGCDIAQGDLFARPAAAAELERSLGDRHWKIPLA